VRVAKALPPGDVDLMIRPERLRLRAPGESGGDDNTFAMTVDDIINYGDSILVLGQTHGLPLRARLMGGQTVLPPREATLHLAWAPQDAHALARTSGP
jgi:ABC-type Fe3+/spermidine/putrescine transport system ATPase subunit